MRTPREFGENVRIATPLSSPATHVYARATVNRVAVRKPRVFLYILLAILAGYHAQLLQKGALAWPDEHYYFDALRTIQRVSERDLTGAAKALTGFAARPLANTSWLVPASIQTVAARAMETQPLNRNLVRIASAWNVAIAFALIIVFHRLALWFYEGDEGIAAAAAATYALLPTSHLWVRHVVPYEVALLLFILDLYLVVSRPTPEDPPNVMRRLMIAAIVVSLAGATYALGVYVFRPSALPLSIVLLSSVVWATRYIFRDTQRVPLLAGLIAGAGMLIYPAYYVFPAALLALIAFSRTDRILKFRPVWLACALFTLGVLNVLFTFEVIARIGGVSYLGSAARVSGTVTQGSYEEGFVFLPKLLMTLDGTAGIVIVILALLYVLSLMSRKVRSPRETVLARCLVIFALLYLLYGIQAVVLHEMSFSGRFVKMYVPAVILAAFAFLRVLPVTVRRVGLVTMVALGGVTFAAFAYQYARVDYPIDVLARFGIGYDDIAPQNRVAESAIITNYNLPLKVMMPGTRFHTVPNDRRYVLVNFAFLALSGPDFREYQPPAAARLIFRATHFQCSRFSQFEVSIPRRRQFQISGPCELKIYRLTDDGSGAL